MSDARAKMLLDELYAELPALACEQRCHSSCGPIAMTRVEWARIIKRKGHEPRATSIDCPLLAGHSCSVYSIRPLICRLWGVIETMPCPWGCKPDPGYLTVAEGYDLLLRAELISEPDRAAEIEEMRQRFRDAPALVEVSKLLHVRPRRE